MFKILVCDEALTFTVKELLPNYHIDIAYNINDILEFTYEKNYDLIIVNYYFYNTILELKNSLISTIIIFLDEYYDIFHLKESFKIADDYLIKPLIMEELQIRINYQYKKIFKQNKTTIKYKKFFYHTSLKQLFLNNDKIKITPNETKLIELFLLNISKPINVDSLYETINNYSNGTLRVYISKIKKLGFTLDYDRSNLSYTLLEY